MSRHASHPSDRHGLMELTGALCNGAIDGNQLSLLERRLLESADARAVYRRYLNLHASLRRCSVMEQNATCRPSNYPILSFLGGTARWTREYFSQPGPFSVLAAAIFIVCMVALLSILPAPTYEHIRSNCAYNSTDDGNSTNSPGRKPRDRDVAKKLNFVARITGLHDCKWSKDGRAPYGFDYLQIGRVLKLDSGLLKITYKTGANIILEGPVEFTVEKPNACRLDLGKLTAKVPRPAIGFTIETPSMTVVDLGTEFSVVAEQSGAAEVHVFRGAVKMISGSDGSQGRLAQRLIAGQAARIESGSDGGVIRYLTDGGRGFVRAMPAQASVSQFVHTGRNNPESEGWTLAKKGTGKTSSGNDGMDYWEIDCTGSGIVTLNYRVDSNSPGFLGIIDNPGGWSMKGIVKVTTGNNSVNSPCLKVQDDLGDPNADSRDGNPGTWGDSWAIHLIDTGDPATTGVYIQTLLSGDSGVFLAQVDLSEYHTYEIIMTRGATIQEDSVTYKVDDATIATLARTEIHNTQQRKYLVPAGTRFLDADFGKTTTEHDVDSVHRWNSVEFAARNTSSGDGLKN